MRSTLLLPFTLLFSLSQPALGAAPPPQVCRSLAALLHTHFKADDEPGSSQTLLGSIAHNSRGRLSVAAWESNGPQRASYLQALGLKAISDQHEPATATAGKLVAVLDSEGSAGCADVSLFRSNQKRLVKLAPPYVTKIMTCARGGGFLSIASLDGQPFVVRETRDTNTQIAQVSPLNGQRWNAPCAVVVKYVPMLVSQGAVCHAGDCTGAEVEAKRIATQIQAAEPRGGNMYEAGDNPQLDYLVNMAGQTPATKVVPAASDLIGDDNITYLEPYLATVDGRPALALANVWRSGPASDSEGIGYAVALWQEAGHKLVPVAGFHLLTKQSKIKSIWVTR